MQVDEKPTNSGAAAPLGNKTKSSPPPQGRDVLQELRIVRYELQSKARGFYVAQGAKDGLTYPQNYHRTAKCKYVPTGSLVGVNSSKVHKSAFYTGLVSCGCVWTCPVCVVKIQERRRQEIAKAVDFAYANGLQAVMVTLTFPHKKHHTLPILIKRQADALARLRKGKAWDKFKIMLAYLGLIRSLELTYGVKNGWHPHTHELWFVDKDADADDIKEFILDKWWSACLRAGLVQDTDETKKDFYMHSVDVRGNCSTSDYLAKQDSSKHWGVDREVAKASSKKGKDNKGLHPFAFLTDDNENSALWLEYSQAIKGKSQLFWSHGLKKKFGIDEKTDEELAEEENDTADVLGMLEYQEWKLIRWSGNRAKVLDIAENFPPSEAWQNIKILLYQLKLKWETE